MTQEAWYFKAIEPHDLRYFGNDGYDDDSSCFYRYDSFVANYKNVKTGDIVIIANRDNVLGCSVIEKIDTNEIEKKRNKCPYANCDQRKIRPRKNKKPKWRCNNGHEFENPKVVLESAVEFIARYGNNYKEIENIDISQLIEKTLKYNFQMSIQKIDLSWATQVLKSQSTFYLNIEDTDADNDTPDFESEDKRKIILSQIRQRRGQSNFRNNLLDLHPVCAVTGCALVDILEAAHIDAYRNDTHNHISNGLLLRSDIHTLFDLNLCAINPNTNKVTFSQKALKCGYNKLEGNYLNIKHKISSDAILRRWIKFIK